MNVFLIGVMHRRYAEKLSDGIKLVPKNFKFISGLCIPAPQTDWISNIFVKLDNIEK